MDRNKRNIPNEIIYLVSAVIVLFISFIGFSDAVSPSINAVFTPFLSISSEGGMGLRSAYDSVGDLNELRHERNDLLVENATLKAENAVVQQMQDEIDLLRKEAKLSLLSDKTIEVEVISNGDEQVSEYLIVNEGSDEGVSEGDIARVGNLFVGMIDDVASRRARVMLPTQGRSSFEVIIIPNQPDMSNLSVEEIGSLVGDKNTKVWKGVALGGSTGIIIENIEKNSTVKDGDHVIVNDQDVGTLLYLGDIGDVNLAPSDVGISASVVVPLNYRNILKLVIDVSE